MYISVVPTSKSHGRHPYSYSVSEVWQDQIVIGGLVEIPLGKYIVTGIISSLSDISPSGLDLSDIKPIHAVISSTPLLSGTNISILLALAEKYYLLIHKALALVLSRPLLTRLEKRNYVLSSETISEGSHEPKNQGIKELVIHHFIDQIFSPYDLDSYLEDESVLVFPSDMMLMAFMYRYGQREDICILMAGTTAAKRCQAWIDIYEGKYRIIVGTRRILLYNLSRYKKIIYIEDAFGSELYQYPFTIRCLDILRYITDRKAHDITIVTSSPSLELLSVFRGTKIEARRNISL